MTTTNGKYADFEGLREQAVALRRAGLSRRQIRDRMHVDNNNLLNRLLEGEPAPEWTKHPNAKDDLRDRARELRLQGMTYDEIQVELGCSKSSISLWVRDLPKPTPRYTPEEQRALMNAGLKRLRNTQDEERRRTKEAARREIGSLTDRELFLLGVGLYWAEGGKDKSYDRREVVVFVNSDPGMIVTFLAWLKLLGVCHSRLRYGVMIHENADVSSAEKYWANVTGATQTSFYKTTLKTHNPKTVRKNVGDDYHGCLLVKVRQGADLYRRIEGWWGGIVESATAD